MMLVCHYYTKKGYNMCTCKYPLINKEEQYHNRPVFYDASNLPYIKYTTTFNNKYTKLLINLNLISCLKNLQNVLPILFWHYMPYRPRAGDKNACISVCLILCIEIQLDLLERSGESGDLLPVPLLPSRPQRAKN